MSPGIAPKRIFDRAARSAPWLLFMAIVLSAATTSGATDLDYPSKADLRPFHAALQSVHFAAVYELIPRSETPADSSPSARRRKIDGYAYRRSATVARQSWLDSLVLILSDTTSYYRTFKRCRVIPEYSIHLFGQGDSVVARLGSGCSYLEMSLGPERRVWGYFVNRTEAMDSLLASSTGYPTMSFASAIRAPGPPPEASSYDVAPVPITRVRPELPDFAREAGIEGDVVLDLLVGADGRVKKIRDVQGITGLTQSARATAFRWVFKPARYQGNPVAAWYRATLEFRLPSR